MADITFIYRIIRDINVYYGKYNSDYFDKDHEGLNLEIEKVLLFGLNEYRRQIKLPLLKQDDITVGIISCETQVLNYITEKEIKCFDFYCIERNRDKQDFYIFGSKLNFNQSENTPMESSGMCAEPKYNNYVLELQDIEN